MADEPTIYVVDDDNAVRDSLRWLVESVGLRVKTYASAQDFLADYDPDRPGCLVLDIRMPGMSGLELQEKFASQANPLPVIIITGHGDVPVAVRALKAGATDFIEKPFNDQMLLDRIQEALSQAQRQQENRARLAQVRARYDLLTPRECEVMAMVVQGESNKRIALALGVSAKTVEVHRAKVMEKMRAGSLAELVRIALLLQEASPPGEEAPLPLREIP